MDLGLDEAILATKVHRPRTDDQRVARARLHPLLDRGATGPLTVVSAPTGFGKTTLVADWLSSCWRGRSGWVSLGTSENDRSLFWAYLCTALEQADVPGAAALLPAAFAPGPHPTEALVAPMLQRLSEVEVPLAIVLDDYHLISDSSVHEAMALLVKGSPDGVHWMMLTRTSIPFPVGRLRARGRLVEVGPDDLRFTHRETAAFLSERFTSPPSAAVVDRLLRRTEGWAAGLQLASLTAAAGDPASVAATFTGDHPWVAELLLEEVLDRQTPEVRRFLLYTSVLDRFNAELAEAVVGTGDAGVVLREVRRRRLFLVDLDSTREWFRYHHLFGEMLRAKLNELEPEAPERLHAAASRWFDERGLLEEAVHHAFLARDPEWTAEVVERGWRRMDRSFRSERWLEWAERLPSARVRERPVLAMGVGWALLDVGRIDEAEPLLERVGEWLDGSVVGIAPKVAAEPDFRILGGTLAAARAYLAQAHGDLEATEQHARRALELLPRHDPFYRGIPAVTLGLGQLARGDLDRAAASFAEGLHAFRAAGNTAYVHGGLYAIAEVRLEQGQLPAARALFEEARRLEGADLPRSDEVAAGLAEILLEEGLPDEAEAMLAECDSGAVATDPRVVTVQAELATLRGDFEGALALLDELLASRLEADRLPRRRPIEARRARLLVAMGALDDAERWARTCIAAVASDGDPPGPFRIDELLALAELEWARLRRGDGTAEEVEERLRWIDDAATPDTTPRLGAESLFMRARLEEHRGDRGEARRLVGEGVARAAPEGLVRVAWRSAPPTALASAVAADARWAALQSRLDALAVEPSEGSPLEQYLTPREVEVLGLIRDGLRNKDIAARLFISLSTVKRHIANVYAKLGVTHRTAAVARMEELGGG